MTRTRTLTIAGALMAVALVTAAPAAQAQQGGPPPGGMGRRPPMMDRRGGPPPIDEMLRRMTSELSLTPDQANKLKAVLTQERHVADSLHAVHAVQREAERTAAEARRANHEKAVLAILTPEQRTKHEALMKERRGRGGPDGRRPDGPPLRGRPGDSRENR